jgi:hypothetical protein
MAIDDLKRYREKERHSKYETAISNLPFVRQVQQLLNQRELKLVSVVWTPHNYTLTIRYTSTVVAFYASQNKCKITQGNINAKVLPMTGEELHENVLKGESAFRRLL